MDVKNLRKRLEMLQWSLDEYSLRIRPVPCAVMWAISPLGERFLLLEEGAYKVLLAHVRRGGQELPDHGVEVRRLQNFSIWAVTRGEEEALRILELLARTAPSDVGCVEMVCGGGSVEL